MPCLPSVGALWSQYPSDEDPEAVKKAIGGNVNAAWITNTCTVRLSRALNYSGAPIRHGMHGMLTVSGGDHKWYGIRVKEMAVYLEKTYGAPSFKATGDLKSACMGKKGIIRFVVNGWSDATGHFDIWNFGSIRHHEYFAQASEVYIWEC